MIREALNGIYFSFSEKSIQYELMCAFLALIAVAIGFFKLIPTIICIGLVLSLEMMNTAIETLCDYIIPEKDPKIKLIKDISAGSVLIAAITSLIIGLVMVMN